MSSKTQQLMYETNLNFLSLICQCSANDIAHTQILFGVPHELAHELKILSLYQIEALARAPICLITLRNCGNHPYWKSLIKCSTVDSSSHRLGLVAQSLMGGSQNLLPAWD